MNSIEILNSFQLCCDQDILNYSKNSDVCFFFFLNILYSKRKKLELLYQWPRLLLNFNLNINSATHYLCDLGQVIQPLMHHFLICRMGIPIIIISWVVIKVKLKNTSRLVEHHWNIISIPQQAEVTVIITGLNPNCWEPCI